jgi:hypothetical protein
MPNIQKALKVAASMVAAELQVRWGRLMRKASMHLKVA